MSNPRGNPVSMPVRTVSRRPWPAHTEIVGDSSHMVKDFSSSGMAEPLVLCVPHALKAQTNGLLNISSVHPGPRFASLVRFMMGCHYGARYARVVRDGCSHVSLLVMQRVSVACGREERGADMYFLYQLTREEFLRNQVYRLAGGRCTGMTPEKKKTVVEHIVSVLSDGKFGCAMSGDSDSDDEDDAKSSDRLPGGVVLSDAVLAAIGRERAMAAAGGSDSDDSPRPPRRRSRYVASSSTASESDAADHPMPDGSEPEPGRRRARDADSPSGASDAPQRAKRRKASAAVQLRRVVNEVTSAVHKERFRLATVAQNQCADDLLYKMMTGDGVKYWTHLVPDNSAVPFFSPEQNAEWLPLVGLAVEPHQYCQAVIAYLMYGKSRDVAELAAGSGLFTAGHVNPATGDGEGGRLVPSKVLTLDNAVAALRVALLDGCDSTLFSADDRDMIARVLDRGSYRDVYTRQPVPGDSRARAEVLDVVGPVADAGRVWVIPAGMCDQLGAFQDPAVSAPLDTTSDTYKRLTADALAAGVPAADVCRFVEAQMTTHSSVSGGARADPLGMVVQLRIRAEQVASSGDVAAFRAWAATQIEASLQCHGDMYHRTGLMMGMFHQAMRRVEPENPDRATNRIVSAASYASACARAAGACKINSRDGRFPSSVFFTPGSMSARHTPVHDLAAAIMWDAENVHGADCKHRHILLILMMVMDTARYGYGDAGYNLSIFLSGASSVGKNWIVDVVKKMCVPECIHDEVHMSAQACIGGETQFGTIMWTEEKGAADIGAIEGMTLSLAQMVATRYDPNSSATTSAKGVLTKASCTSRVTSASRVTVDGGVAKTVTTETTRFGTAISASNLYHCDASSDVRTRLMNVMVTVWPRELNSSNRVPAARGARSLTHATQTLHFMCFALSMLINCDVVRAPAMRAGRMCITGAVQRLRYNYLEIASGNNRMMPNVVSSCYPLVFNAALLDLFVYGLGAVDPRTKWSVQHLIDAEPLLVLDPYAAGFAFEMGDFMGYGTVALIAGIMRHNVFGMNLRHAQSVARECCPSLVQEDDARTVAAHLVLDDAWLASRASHGEWLDKSDVPRGVRSALKNAESFASQPEASGPRPLMPFGAAPVTDTQRLIARATALVEVPRRDFVGAPPTGGGYFELRHFFPSDNGVPMSRAKKIAYLAECIAEWRVGAVINKFPCAEVLCRLTEDCVYTDDRTNKVPALRITGDSTSLLVHCKLMAMHDASIACAVVETIGFPGHERGYMPSEDELRRGGGYMRPNCEGSIPLSDTPDVPVGQRLEFDATRHSTPVVHDVEYRRIAPARPTVAPAPRPEPGSVPSTPVHTTPGGAAHSATAAAAAAFSYAGGRGAASSSSASAATAFPQRDGRTATPLRVPQTPGLARANGGGGARAWAELGAALATAQRQITRMDTVRPKRERFLCVDLYYISNSLNMGVPEDAELWYDRADAALVRRFRDQIIEAGPNPRRDAESRKNHQMVRTTFDRLLRRTVLSIGGIVHFGRAAEAAFANNAFDGSASRHRLGDRIADFRKTVAAATRIGLVAFPRALQAYEAHMAGNEDAIAEILAPLAPDAANPGADPIPRANIRVGRDARPARVNGLEPQTFRNPSVPLPGEVRRNALYGDCTDPDPAPATIDHQYSDYADDSARLLRDMGVDDPASHFSYPPNLKALRACVTTRILSGAPRVHAARTQAQIDAWCANLIAETDLKRRHRALGRDSASSTDGRRVGMLSEGHVLEALHRIGITNERVAADVARVYYGNDALALAHAVSNAFDSIAD